jgi:prepilin-type N-terminal cleavage/methylation domain-containing protein
MSLGQRRRVAGFTMIELIMVMLIVATMVTLAIPRFMAPSALQARGAQDQLRDMLVSTRRLAVTQSRDVCVLLTGTQARAVYTAANLCAAGLPVASPNNDGPWVITMPNGVLLSGAAQVRFNARGQPVPAANATINVGAQALTVQRETGRAL